MLKQHLTYLFNRSIFKTLTKRQVAISLNLYFEGTITAAFSTFNLMLYTSIAVQGKCNSAPCRRPLIPKLLEVHVTVNFCWFFYFPSSARIWIMEYTSGEKKDRWRFPAGVISVGSTCTPTKTSRFITDDQVPFVIRVHLRQSCE